MNEENQNLIGVLAAIDEAVHADDRRRADVVAYFPVYRDQRTVGWFEAFGTWIAGRAEHEGAAVVPQVDAAVAAMSAQPPDDMIPVEVEADDGGIALPPLDGPQLPSVQARRRAQALLALASVLPERFGPAGEREADVVGALVPFTRDSRPEQAEELLVRSRQRAPSVDSWFQPGLIMRTSGAGRHAVPFLETKAGPLKGRQLRRVQELMSPELWPKLNPAFWDEMVLLDDAGVAASQPVVLDDRPPAEPLAAPHCYQEVFVVAPGLTLRPILEVVRTTLAGGSAEALEYRLCRHQHGDGVQDPAVLHDDGSIVNRQLAGGVEVHTTKRVGFDGPFDGPALAMAAHAFGYQEAFEGMVATALILTNPLHPIP